MLAAEWRSIEHMDEAVAVWTGQVLVMQAPAPARAMSPGKNLRRRRGRPPTADHRPFAEKCW